MVDQQPSRPGIEASLAPFVIRPQQADDIDAVVALSIRAWQPVFESMGRVLGPRLNRIVYPDWAAGQARAVEEVCRDEGVKVWVAEIGTRPVGFVAVTVHDDPRSAEIDMIAVDPDQQCRGIGSALLALRWIASAPPASTSPTSVREAIPATPRPGAPTRRPDSRRCRSFTTTRNCLRSAPTDRR
jgi:GNAT superfamily N-acetyltransferase